MFSPSFLFNPVTSSQDLDEVPRSTLVGVKGISNMEQETYFLSCSDNEITVDEIKIKSHNSDSSLPRPLATVWNALGASQNLSSQQTSVLRAKSAWRCFEAMRHFLQTPDLPWFTEQNFASTKRKAWRDEGREGEHPSTENRSAVGM